MPLGSIISAMQGAGKLAAGRAIDIEPKIAGLRRQALSSYLKMMQPYEMYKAREKMMRQMQLRGLVSETAGDIASQLMMYNAGLYNQNPELGPAASQPIIYQ